MSPKNPFCLTQSIFSDRCKKFLNVSYDSFVEEFFYDWICFAQTGEFETTIAYPEILHNIKTGKYNDIIKNLDTNSKLVLYQYFDRMIIDENNHSDFINSFVHSIYNKTIPVETLHLIERDTKQLIATATLDSLLTRYYIGECYLWTGFYLIYKQTDNSDIKKLFHKLLVDESHHNNNIYKFFKKIKHNIRLDNIEFINNTSNLKYFGHPFVVKKLGLFSDNSKKAKWWNELVYNHSWHHEFNKIFLKKCFQLYKLFYSEMTFDEFFTMINKNELDWLPQEKLANC
jgi:hypothetical protein